MAEFGGEQIADYTWLDVTQRSWRIWLGNPLVIQMLSIPKKQMTREQVIAMAREMAADEKMRFTAMMPEVEWVTFEN